MTPPPEPSAPRWHRRARHALAHSLRVRLVVLFLLLALALAAAFLLGMQRALSAGWRDAARPLVVDYVDRLAADLGSPPSVARAQALVQRLPVTVRISGPSVNWRSYTNQASSELRWRDGWGQDDWRHQEPRLLERTTSDGHRIVFGLNLQIWHERPRYVGWVTLAVLLVLTALAYARVRHLLRPLDAIGLGAQRFGRGDFSQPIAVRNPRAPDELGELAITINTMALDLQGMLDAKRALLLAISHELRSPLTRARLHTELLPDNVDVKPARDALLRDLALMRDLVADLLESERLASPHAALQREPTDLAALVAEVVQGLDGAPRVDQVLAANLPTLQLDRARMRLLLRNLLDNALRHSPAAAQAPGIGVSLAAAEPGLAPPAVTPAKPATPAGETPGWLLITVRDFGPGVDAAALAHLTEPFYRADASRERATGGVGLGLYLCKLVAQAHGGSLMLFNRTPGLEVQVRLPLTL